MYETFPNHSEKKASEKLGSILCVNYPLMPFVAVTCLSDWH